MYNCIVYHLDLYRTQYILYCKCVSPCFSFRQLLYVTSLFFSGFNSPCRRRLKDLTNLSTPSSPSRGDILILYKTLRFPQNLQSHQLGVLICFMKLLQNTVSTQQVIRIPWQSRITQTWSFSETLGFGLNSQFQEGRGVGVGSLSLDQ